MLFVAGTWGTAQVALHVYVLGPNALPGPWPALPRPGLPLIAYWLLSLLKLTAVSIGSLLLCIVIILTGSQKHKQTVDTLAESALG